MESTAAQQVIFPKRRSAIEYRTPRFVGRPPRRAALRIALIYALFGTCWIHFSDLILEAFVRTDIIRQYRIQTLKGGFFIVVTALMVYVLIRRTVTAFHATEAARHESENRLKLLVERARDYAIFTLD